MVFNSDQQDGNYHHGNLKQTLVDAYIELLPSTPMDKLSLRKLATHIGVAPTAVYNHFTDKEELLVAVKIRCLFHFAKYLETETDPSLSAKDRIRNLGKRYFQYSLEYLQFFNILFSTKVEDKYVTDELIEGSMRAESALRAAVADLLEENAIPSTQYNEGLGAFACWSLAHGITSLASVNVNHAACATGRWPPEFMLDNNETVLKVFDSMSNVLVEGILVTARNNND